MLCMFVFFWLLESLFQSFHHHKLHCMPANFLMLCPVLNFGRQDCGVKVWSDGNPIAMELHLLLAVCLLFGRIMITHQTHSMSRSFILTWFIYLQRCNCRPHIFIHSNKNVHCHFKQITSISAKNQHEISNPLKLDKQKIFQVLLPQVT